MLDVYNDLSPLQVILKAPQVGATVMNTLKSFYVAKKKHKQIIYTLPTEADMQAMVGVTINRLVVQNPILQSWVKDHDTVSQKIVGDSIINYRGTWSPKQAMMIPSDLNIHDEVDASDADVIVQYETRLQAKADGWRWYFSHPSVAGFGVDVYWQQSDKKEWVITCAHCKKQQILVWPESIDAKKSCYQCKYCHAELTDNERKMGEWKPTSTGVFSGYHISQLMCPWIRAEKILKDKAEKEEQYFYNYVLGLPYIGSENKISSQTILKNVIDIVNEQHGRVIIGVDTGLPIHYVCMNSDGAFYYGTCDGYDELEKLLLRWKNSILVADQGGDLIGIRQLQEKFVGRVFLVYYRKDRKQQELIQWNDDGTVTVDRNRMFQLMVEQFRDIGRIPLNGTPDEWKLFASHFDNVYRELRTVKNSPGKDISTNYGVELIWKRNGPDHFCHSMLYALVGLDRFAQSDSYIIKKDSFMSGVKTGHDFEKGIPAIRIKKDSYHINF